MKTITHRAMGWRNKNFGKHPQDPDYIDDYDEDEDLDMFEEEKEDKWERMRQERDYMDK